MKILQRDLSIDTHGVGVGLGSSHGENLTATKALLRTIDGHTDVARMLRVLVSGSEQNSLGGSLGSLKENLDFLGARNSGKATDKNSKLLQLATVSSKQMEARINLGLKKSIGPSVSCILFHKWVFPHTSTVLFLKVFMKSPSSLQVG